MARKKNIDPLAAALIIGAVGLGSWLIWKNFIDPKRQDKKAQSMGVDSSINGEILDAQFEIIDNDQQA